MDMYIKWDKDEQSIQIPVLPNTIMMSGNQNNTAVNIHNLGDINLKGKRGLYSVAIESFFPCQRYDFCRCKPLSPDEYIEKITKLFEKNTTVHVILTESNINFYATIDNWSHGVSAGTKDVNYSISFTEYRELESGKRNSKEAKTGSYTWKKGDTWQSVTKTKLGSSKTWKTQRKNNKSVIDKAMKKHPKKKEKVALIGYKVTIKK